MKTIKNRGAKHLGKILLTILLMLVPAGACALDTLHVEFMNVGKADAILIRTGDTTVVIDAATNSMGKEVAGRLAELGCDRIDLLMITHFDKDHVGGADKLIKAFPVGQILMPDYESDSKQTRQFFEAIDEYGVACEPLTENRSVDVGPLTFVIDTANESDYGKNEENDFSLVASLKYGSIGFLFTGDAENKRLGELLKEGVSHHDVLKVPHHGRVEKRSASFFEAVSPKHAVITSSQDNPEDTAVVEALKAAGAHVWLTRLGSVIFMTDGQYLDVVQTE